MSKYTWKQITQSKCLLLEHTRIRIWTETPQYCTNNVFTKTPNPINPVQMFSQMTSQKPFWTCQWPTMTISGRIQYEHWPSMRSLSACTRWVCWSHTTIKLSCLPRSRACLKVDEKNTCFFFLYISYSILVIKLLFFFSSIELERGIDRVADGDGDGRRLLLPCSPPLPKTMQLWTTRQQLDERRARQR